MKLLFYFIALTFPVWGVMAALIIMLGIMFSVFEDTGIWHSIYFAFITALTVGYGDVSPTTSPGMVLSILMGILGLISTGIIVAVAVQIAYAQIKEIIPGDIEKMLQGETPDKS